jgi:PKD repeat protein
MSMDWDPTLEGIVLAGGYEVDGLATAGTWLFVEGSWENITDSVGGLSASPPTAYGAMAWDVAAQSLVYVGGCAMEQCGVPYDAQWTLGTGGTWQESPSYGNSSGESLAYDAADQELIAFGGANATLVQQNATWSFGDGSWSNMTSSSVGCFFQCNLYPSGRVAPSMTWDSLTDSILLVGGWNVTSRAYVNDSWTFSGSSWFPLPDDSVGAAPVETMGTMPVNSSGYAPVLVSGTGPAAGDTFVLESPAVPRISVTPSPADAGANVTVSVMAGADTGSGPWEELDSNYGDSQTNLTVLYGITGSTAWSVTNSSLRYPGPATVEVETTLSDFFHIGATTSYNLTLVSKPLVAVSSPPDPIESGFAVTFGSSVSSGVPPYSYLWNFGDGNSSILADPTHTYRAPGNYNASLTVTDAGAGSAGAVTAVLVTPGVIALATSNVSSTDAGVPVGFTGSASNGSGPYTRFAWSFGDGSTGNGPIATHAFTVGTYLVVLRVTDRLGYVASNSLSLAVNPAPALGAITATPTYPSVGVPATFEVGTVGGTPPFTCDWSFGDGASGLGPSSVHTFSSAGTFEVSVVVTDSVGMRGSAQYWINVTSSTTNNGPPSSSDLGLFLIFGSVVTGLALVGVFLRSRARAPPARTPPDPSSKAGTETSVTETRNGDE